MQAKEDFGGRGFWSYHYLLPALLGLVFVGLFLGLALVNSERLEKALLEAEINKAAFLAEEVERSMAGFYMLLSGGERRTQWPGGEYVMGIGTSSPDDLLLTTLVDLAREMDSRQEEGRIAPEALAELARAQNFLHILFLDPYGGVIMKDPAFPASLLERARELLNSEGSLFVRLSFQGPDLEGPAFVALKRAGGKGLVLLAFGERELDFWRFRVSLQGALEALEGRTEVLYLKVKDQEGRILAHVGQVGTLEDNDRAGLARFSLGEKVLLEKEIGEGEPVLEVKVPLVVGGNSFILFVGAEGGKSRELIRRNRFQIHLTTAMMTSMAFLAVILLYLTHSRQQARLNEMKERLRQEERFSALGRLAGVVAHEVRNPLNAISIAAQRLAKEYTPGEKENRDEFSKLVGIIREEISRINRIVEDVLGVGRREKLDIREIPIRDLLDRVKTLMEAQASSRNLRILVSDQGSNHVIMADGEKMMQALLNLVKNSLEAIPPEGGTVYLSCTAEGKERAVIEVSDTGSGIPPENMEKIFDMGFTTKEKGLGLGLHIAREIIQLHGGELKVRGREGGGTTFSVHLPAKEPTPRRRSS